MCAKTKHREGLPERIRRIVIKVGTRILVDERGRPDPERIDRLSSEIASLHSGGIEVILVSSGAIAAGVQTLGWNERPAHLPELQMAAAVGQSVLMQQYANAFSNHDCRIGQVLLTHSDLRNRERHLNARNTMLAMLRNRVVPVVNENDVVAVDEIRFGDNDLLAAMVSTLVGADLLLLLTSADGFYLTENGRLTERVSRLEQITDEVLQMAGEKGSEWSIGGMASKLRSARDATQAGTPVLILNGAEKGVIGRALDGEDLGTLILPEERSHPLRARKKWIAFFQRPQGSIFVDRGAEEAIRDRGNSLLPAGVDHTKGEFRVGSFVNVRSLDGKTFARGITAYSNEEIERIKGRHSTEIPDILGHSHFEEVIHRDNMVILQNET